MSLTTQAGLRGEAVDAVPMQSKPFSKPKPERAIVWTIAGSDSGGGAGIQADLATIWDLGSHGCSIITSLTAQNSVKVSLAQPVSPGVLLAQLDSLQSDLPPSAIKVGLLANQNQIRLLADWLASFRRDYPGVPVIVDPVMLSSSGDALTDREPMDLSPLAGLIELVTPNVSELALLSVKRIDSETDLLDAASTLAARLECSVLVTGGDPWQAGDDTGKARDLLLCGDLKDCSELHRHSAFWLSSPRIDTQNNHGTGCTLSSAIAAVLAQGYVLPDAIVVAKAYVGAGLSHSYRIGSGPGPLGRCGWPTDLALFPRIEWHGAPVSWSRVHGFRPLPLDLGLYPVVGDLKLLESLLQVGAHTIQLRLKRSAGNEEEEIEAQIVTAIALGRRFEARLFINDHWQLALKHGAFGVHLGQEDLLNADLHAIAEAGMALGLSSHGYFELLLARQLAPSYLALGHIFATNTKQMPSRPQGVERLAHYVRLHKSDGPHKSVTWLSRTHSQHRAIPLVAIGGIDATNLCQVSATGVDNVAMVSALTQVPDPGAAFKALSRQWEQAHE
jgi:hydroxymethylpyrimidine kinase / phosphomethylpyrimidine kinase / thiamine-phosphate diphosphorylase